MALFVNVALLLLVTLNVTFEHALDVRLHVTQIVLKSEPLKTGGAQFLFGIADQLAHGVVDLEPTAVD